jgi:hypothetical protein
VVGVDIGDLNVDKALSVGRSGAEAFAQKLRDGLDELCMQPWETLEFLRTSDQPS